MIILHFQSAFLTTPPPYAMRASTQHAVLDYVYSRTAVLVCVALA
jgi:hypothetical protein